MKMEVETEITTLTVRCMFQFEKDESQVGALKLNATREYIESVCTETVVIVCKNRPTLASFMCLYNRQLFLLTY